MVLARQLCLAHATQLKSELHGDDLGLPGVEVEGGTVEAGPVSVGCRQQLTPDVGRVEEPLRFTPQCCAPLLALYIPAAGNYLGLSRGSVSTRLSSE
jgi:hypothetical protein